MKASKTALVAALVFGSIGLAAGSVSACGGGGGYGGGYGGYHKKVYVKKVYVQPVHVHVEPICHPAHCFAIVNPGDTWFTLSLREYGKPHLWKKIAIFNGLPLNAGLVPGMQLKLPVIHPGGVLVPSSAPAPIAIGGPIPGGPVAGGPIGLPTGGGIPQQNFIQQGATTGAPQANFALQGGVQPQANFAPQSSPQMGAPNMLQGNGPMMQNFGGPNASQSNGAPNMIPQNMGPQNFGQPNMGQPNGPTFGQPNVDTSAMTPIAPIAPTATIRTVSTERSLPSVAIGSVLSLDGQSLGTDRGTVRLKVNGLALPIEVLEWSTTSVKIQLPRLELTGAMNAEIEVLRADGSVASKSAVELTTATSRLALGN
jgi:hypothetical protein